MGSDTGFGRIIKLCPVLLASNFLIGNADSVEKVIWDDTPAATVTIFVQIHGFTYP